MALVLVGAEVGLWATEPGDLHGAQVGQPSPRTLSEVKSYYLINFARFVEWPAGAFSSSDAPLLIGILGRDPLGRALQAYEGQTIKGHRIKILRSRDIRDLGGCQVLYISESEEDDLGPLFRILKAKPVLTFGETEGFQGYGGMVRFAEEQGQVKIRVNRRSTETAQLQVSSRLLAITTIVDP